MDTTELPGDAAPAGTSTTAAAVGTPSSAVRQWIVTAAQPAATALEIVNGGSDTARFFFNVNDRLFVRNLAGAVADALSLPDTRPDEPDHSKFWRWIGRRTVHASSINTERWTHSPTLLANSIGFGMCDDRASAFAALARSHGYEVRIWDLNGHVVPEVLNGSRWEVWDPDYGVRYLTDRGDVASVEDLQSDPTLVTSPRGPLVAGANDGAYGSELAALYSSASDNRLYDWYLVVEPRGDLSFELPPGASIRIGGRFSRWPRSFTGTPSAQFATLSLRIPAGWTGTLAPDLVPLAVSGSGAIRFGGREMAIGDLDFGGEISTWRVAPDPIEIVRSEGPITIHYLVNRNGSRLQNVNSVAVTGSGISGLTVRSVALAPDEVMSDL